MERPGLLELTVYALVFAITASWVYALPPFTQDPASTAEAAVVEPAGSGQPADLTESDSAVKRTEAAATPSATAQDPDREPQLDPRPNLLVVRARSLNMRAAPNADSDLVGNYPRGALVEEMDVSGNWVLVRADDDTTGWMYAGYLGAPEN